MVSCNLRDAGIWAYIYDRIRSDLNLSYSKDHHAAQVLNHMVRGLSEVHDVEERLRALISGAEVYVVGAGPSCLRDLESIKGRPRVLIAANGALRCCLDAGYVPDVVVSDLDGLEHNDLRYKDAIYVIHAHGDNLDRLVRYVKYIRGLIIGTSQSIPYGDLRVYGGFTDGDRAVFLAYYFGAKSIRLLGFNLSSGVIGRYSKPWMDSDSVATLAKLRKFKWAERLISLLRVCSDVLCC